ncbi:hypothetical protein FQN60_016906 [Etheostoma spectabile]|uniref:Uncharacterized protein n=1 Tax=Etheostoma spectabile TaxID=54343 RepID=A0A5J5DDZ8_9PERO|nr:hypothetical protein FQN60_016906 [Etheostoma spectabile]
MVPRTSHIFTKVKKHSTQLLNYTTTNQQIENSNSARCFSAVFFCITFPSSSLSFSPIKQSFQLASKLFADLSWGPSKPPVCRQV